MQSILSSDTPSSPRQPHCFCLFGTTSVDSSQTPTSEESACERPTCEGTILSSPNLKAFTFNELKSATKSFDHSRLIGEGSFGRVYKGRIGSGTPVAVKKHRPRSHQGRNEWLNEIDYLGRLRHPNIVKLIGFCSQDDNLMLVYEFMPRGSLNDHRTLSWETRVKVAVGVAKGLAFLHDAEKRVVHRDIHLSHVLLDSEFNVKLSGFGLAVAGPTDGGTYFSAEVKGTYGTIDPEYVRTGHLSAKSDVYSFGVLLLELFSGRRAIVAAKSGVEQNLTQWAKTCLGEERKVACVVDPELRDSYPEEGAEAVVVLAVQCTDGNPDLRPCIAEVLMTLEKL